MIFTSIFAFIASIAYAAPLWAWIVGFLCLLPRGLLTPFYALLLVNDAFAPMWVYVVGFMCVIIDSNIMVED